MAMARWVLPTPLVPNNSRFSACSSQVWLKKHLQLLPVLGLEMLVIKTIKLLLPREPLYAVVMEDNPDGVCQFLDKRVKAFMGRPLDHARFPTSTLMPPTHLYSRLGRNMQVVS